MSRNGHHANAGLSRRAILLLVIALLIVVAAPLILNRGASFRGTDDGAQAAVGEIAPGYQPWIKPVWEPSSEEMESALFAFQAALGCAVIGLVLVLRRRGAGQSGRAAPDSTLRNEKFRSASISNDPHEEACS